jgi:cytochrome c biogenesis protein CcmG/thiol:disulfide interchange protein DsbE
MRHWARFVPLAAFAALVAALALGLRRDPAIIPSVLIGKPLPDFALAPLRAGQPGFSAADVKGRVALINVFGSWCAACAEEHPNLLALKGGAHIYGIDWKDEPGAGAQWLARHGDPYERVGGDPDGRLALDLGVTGAPETFVIDKAGRIAYKQIGPITPDIWRGRLAPLIAKLEAE